MATRSALRTRVGIRTNRSNETNFNTLCNEAFDEFLQLAGRRHNFREMFTSGSLTYAADAYSASLPTLSLTGFNTTVKDVVFLRVGLTDDSQQDYPLKLRPAFWLDSYYPDRTRTGSISEKPFFAAVCEGSTLQLQAPASDAYTVTMVCTAIPLSIASDSAEIVIPSLEPAMVEYAMHVINHSLKSWEAADRSWQKAWAMFDIAVEADKKDPARVFIADQINAPGGSSGYRFSLSDLQTVYP